MNYNDQSWEKAIDKMITSGASQDRQERVFSKEHSLDCVKRHRFLFHFHFPFQPNSSAE